MDTDLPRPRWRFTGAYRFTPRFQAGLEYNPVAEELGFIGNWTLNPETEKLPMVGLGTSSDRIGSPPGTRMYYGTIAKGFPDAHVSGYVGLAYSEWDRGFNVPFGVNLHLSPQVTALFMHDGRRSHGLLTYSMEHWSVSAMWIWFKHPGISVSFGF